MATPNGTESPSYPPATSPHVTGKRKRASASEEGNANSPASLQYDALPAEEAAAELQGFLRDLLVILKSFDPSPPLLQRSLPSTNNEDTGTKRPKLSVSNSPLTVASKVAAKAYSSVTQFTRDIDNAISSAIMEWNSDTNNGGLSHPDSHLADSQKKIRQARAMKDELSNLILREISIRPKIFSSVAEAGFVKEDPDAGLGTGNPGDDLSKRGVNRAVLTLYGSAPTPRQLFSSFQQATTPGDPDTFFGGGSGSPVGSIRETALPNGITTTNIVPVHSATTKAEKTKPPTLADILPQPPTLAKLNPPRQSRHTATRSSSVNWISPSETAPSTRSYRRDNYTTQDMGTSQWLTYNVVPTASKLSSPEAKRKQRDRALSFGDTEATLPQETINAHKQAKEDAVFRSAFSSFAPDQDNTGATVNTRTKNRIWWEKTGGDIYRSTLSFPELGDGEETEMEMEETSDHVAERELELFQDAVASWQDEELPAELHETGDKIKEPRTTSEVDEILVAISELLETLNSYQRVRNLSLATNARTTAGQNPQLTAVSGTPSSPSAAEYDVYEMLKSQLTIMVSSLPPFAVARLDGDKLAALNVSTKVQTEGKTFKGTMEEDDVSTRVRPVTNVAPYARSTNPTSTLPTRSSTHTTPAQQQQRTTYAAQPSIPRQSSTYLSNQQYANRPISSSQYYGNANSSNPTPQRAPISTDRYSYSASQQYSQQAPRASTAGYANGYRSPAAQNGTSYGQQYGAPTQGSTAQRPSQPGYQQRAMNSQAYGYVNAAAGRSTSPQQAATAYTPQQRSSYAANNPTPNLNQQRPPMYNAQSPQYGGQSPPNPQVNGTGAERVSNQPMYMTANEQAALMNRQKAQLAEHQRQTPSRHTSDTPQPANGGYNGQMNGASTPQQNGVSVG